ncbi:hypothetical protein CkaCkLH20_12422 [Colletotrichum karsti]|uniref:NmrA-like domain-containing protein n=1 Tax=Colletotrichum karsti TaxID=1095194 RepID=A0A9P6HT45_9PEZI|nr:uncharacterized protein CkaCkLH20_12422 [Colletotrichum karsti]KAF9870063.1 hypothetical protein CkaCkLH20_12422 [Colletotrichum karsti]
MVKIAIAGASSSFAHDVIDAILAKGDHEILALSRQVSQAVIGSWIPCSALHENKRDAATDGRVVCKAVNYDDRNALTETLRGCDVVLCFFTGADPASATQREKVLIDAAINAGVRRFAPSEWATQSNSGTLVYGFKDEFRRYLEDVNKEQKVIEYTLFQPGLFLDFFAHPRPGGRKAIVPGNGDYPLVLTTVRDTAAMIAEAIEYTGEWPTTGGIRGSRMMVSDLVKVAESLRGSFDIEKVDEGDILSGQLSAEWVPILKHPGIPVGQEVVMSRFTAQQFIQGTITGAWDVSDDWNKLMPNFTFTSAKDYLTEIWGSNA